MEGTVYREGLSEYPDNRHHYVLVIVKLILLLLYANSCALVNNIIDAGSKTKQPRASDCPIKEHQLQHGILEYSKGAVFPTQVEVIRATDPIIITGGVFEGSVDFGGGSRYAEQGSFVTGLNSHGDHLWDRIWPNAKLTSLKTAGDKIVAAGLFIGTPAFIRSINSAIEFDDEEIGGFLVVLDSQGGYLWSRTWKAGDMTSVSVEISHVGSSPSIILAGFSNGPIHFGKHLLGSESFPGYFLTNLSIEGKYIWGRHWKVTSSFCIKDVPPDECSIFPLPELERSIVPELEEHEDYRPRWERDEDIFEISGSFHYYRGDLYSMYMIYKPLIRTYLTVSASGKIFFGGPQPPCDPLDFDGKVRSLNTSNSPLFFVVSLDHQGRYLWHKTFEDRVYGIATNKKDNLLVLHGYAFELLDQHGNPVWEERVDIFRDDLFCSYNCDPYDPEWETIYACGVNQVRLNQVSHSGETWLTYWRHKIDHYPPCEDDSDNGAADGHEDYSCLNEPYYSRQDDSSSVSPYLLNLYFDESGIQKKQQIEIPNFPYDFEMLKDRLLIVGYDYYVVDFSDGSDKKKKPILRYDGFLQAWDYTKEKKIWDNVFPPNLRHVGKEAVDSRGRTLIVGGFSGTLNSCTGNSHNSKKFSGFATMIDREGRCLWSKAFVGEPTTNQDQEIMESYGSLLHIAKARLDSSVVLGGWFQGCIDFGMGIRRCKDTLRSFIVALDQEGRYLWDYIGPEDSYLKEITVGKNGELFAVYYFINARHLEYMNNSRYSNIIEIEDRHLIQKLTQDGQLIWETNCISDHIHFYENNYYRADCSVLGIRRDGSVIVASSGGVRPDDPSGDYPDAFALPNFSVSNLDLNGGYEWSRSLSDELLYNRQKLVYRMRNDGSILLVLNFVGRRLLLTTLDREGRRVGQSFFRAEGIANPQIALGENGRLFLVGLKHEETPQTEPRHGNQAQSLKRRLIFVGELDPNGRFIWTRSKPITTDQIKIDSISALRGQLLLQGSFKGSIDFGGGQRFSKAWTGFILALDQKVRYLWDQTRMDTEHVEPLAVLDDGSLILEKSVSGDAGRELSYLRLSPACQ